MHFIMCQVFSFVRYYKVVSFKSLPIDARCFRSRYSPAVTGSYLAGSSSLTHVGTGSTTGH